MKSVYMYCSGDKIYEDANGVLEVHIDVIQCGTVQTDPLQNKLMKRYYTFKSDSR